MHVPKSYQRSCQCFIILTQLKINQIVITQKNLEPGHTQMECDSVHNCIERKLKGRAIHLPSNYLSVIKETRLKLCLYDALMM